ncbi:MAG: YacL family protein, partial [Providencia rustigianii]
MDYQFLKDITGSITAKFSMDHEAIGYWLNEEIKNDLSLLDTIAENYELI